MVRDAHAQIGRSTEVGITYEVRERTAEGMNMRAGRAERREKRKATEERETHRVDDYDDRSWS